MKYVKYWSQVNRGYALLEEGELAARIRSTTPHIFTERSTEREAIEALDGILLSIAAECFSAHHEILERLIELARLEPPQSFTDSTTGTRYEPLPSVLAECAEIRQELERVGE